MEFWNFLDAGDTVDEKKADHIGTFMPARIKSVPFQVPDPEIWYFFSLNALKRAKEHSDHAENH